MPSTFDFCLLHKLIHCVTEVINGLLILMLHRIDDAVLDMILQDHLTHAVQCRFHRRNLYQHFAAVPTGLNHLFDRFHMSDDPRHPIQHCLGIFMDMGVLSVSVLVIMVMGNIVGVEIFMIVFHVIVSLSNFPYHTTFFFSFQPLPAVDFFLCGRYNKQEVNAVTFLEHLHLHMGQHPWRDNMTVLKQTDSTNNHLKSLCAAGAPHGTVVLAEEQTAGKGRLGRSFSSPKGMGIYCSVLLRPQLPPEQLLCLTPLMAEAARRAVQITTGVEPEIKWINDLVVQKRKLCGILTERTEGVIVGIGINCQQEETDFPPELRSTAISLKQILGTAPDRAALTAELLHQIALASDALEADYSPWMASYRLHCLTLGQPVKIIRSDRTYEAVAEDLDSQGGLIVQLPNGTRETVSSGEVSVRGLYGYL